MKLARWKIVATSCFLAALLSVPAWGADTDNRQRTAMPGTLNYVEGQASIGDQALDHQAVGTADLQDGQVLETGNGKAEILLTPGVYLRIGSNTSVQMISSGLTNTQLALNRGEAMLEVDQLYKENDIHITQPGADTRVTKTGLYDFNANEETVRVFDGKAVVTADDRNINVKKNHEVALNSEKIKARGFDKDAVTKNDDLYRWSSLRSQYLSEANVDTARIYYVNGGYGAGWWGPGWYWNPAFGGFTYLPGSGYFYNPFGWGFYSPMVVWRSPVVIGRYHHFDGNRPVTVGRGVRNQPVPRTHGATGGFRGARVGAGGGGLHSGGGARAGGGFHGGGGHR